MPQSQQCYSCNLSPENPSRFGVLEFHSWTARNDRPDRPDRLIFDLDPDNSVSWEEVLGAAFLARDELASFGLKSYLMLTGGKGLHVVSPLTRRHGFDVVKPVAKAFSERIRDRNPSRFVTVSNKKKRKGKIFIDYLRNGKGATAVAPYSLRARKGARVAIPIGWDEVSPEMKSDHFTIRLAADRLLQWEDDPWERFHDTRQLLTKELIKEIGVEI